MKKITLPFLETTFHLRTFEEIILFDKIIKISEEDIQKTKVFLKEAYEKEQTNYPFKVPLFNENAAIWASKIVYFASQLLLNREDTGKEINLLLPDFTYSIDASAIVSADLMLRFLPDIIFELHKTDPNDLVLEKLKKITKPFLYSLIEDDYNPEELNLEIVLNNDCLKQLFLDRIVEKKAIYLAQNKIVNDLLMENFGDYKNHYWKELKLIEKEELTDEII